MAQELGIRPGDEVREASHEQIVEQTARAIITQIREWTGSKVLTAQKRWIFELIQNAVDTGQARKNSVIRIEISHDDKTLTFRHNGGHFTRNEIVAIIYGGSSKPYETVSDYIGRFGTGFLVSHVVSRRISLKGVIETKNGSLCDIVLDLNRESNKIEEISRNIENCFGQLNDVVSMADPGVKHWTEFSYHDYDGKGREAIRLGIAALEDNLPFIFAFNNIDELVINGTTHKKEVYAQEASYTAIRVGADYVYFCQDDENSVSVGVLVRDNAIVNPKHRPGIFVAMPLTETADYIHIPFAINSARFAPTKERDALSSDDRSSDEDGYSDYKTNESILTPAFSMYFSLVDTLAKDEKYTQLHNLVQFSPVAEDKTAQNKLWHSLNKLISDMVDQIVREIPLVDTLNGRKALGQTVFPRLGSDNAVTVELLFSQFYEVVSQLVQNLPTAESVHVWTDLAQALNRFSYADLCIYEPHNLKDDLKHASSGVSLTRFDKLQDGLNLKTGRSIFLDFFRLANAMYKAGEASLEFVEDLLPDQNDNISSRSGSWGKLHFEELEESIPKRLKDIAQRIGYDVRDELVAEDFAVFEIVQKYINASMGVEDVLNKLLKNADYQLPDKIDSWDDESVVGWIELFRWCAANGKLTGDFRAITKENAPREIGDIGRHSFLLPFQHMGIETEFENIYPDRRILHHSYFELENQELENFIESLRTYKAFIASLPVYEQEVNLDYGKLMALIVGDSEGVSKVKHSVKSATAQIATLPFWNEVIGKIANDQTLGRSFFRFVIGFLIEHDNSWRQEASVSCQCTGETHTIVPSRWLASVKTDSWVAIETFKDDELTLVSREATKENLEILFANDENGSLDDLIRVDSGFAIEFLTCLGFDDLDLQIKQYAVRKGVSEQKVRKEASQLIPLVGTLSEEVIQDIKALLDNAPDLLDEALEEARKKLGDTTDTAVNRTIGENVERIVKRIIRDNGLDVEKIHIGGDLQIWPDKTEGWDSGALSIPPYTMEVKFTTGSRVHLSRAQSERARHEHQNYLILVVGNAAGLRERLRIELDDDDITGELKNEIIRSSHVVRHLHTKLGTLPNPSEIDPDLHGYWLKRQLWGDLENVQNWLDEVLLHSQDEEPKAETTRPAHNKEFGVVKWFDATKGYGFIERPEANDVFVHFTQVVNGREKPLETGQRVVFTIGQGRKGPEAQNVVGDEQ